MRLYKKRNWSCAKAEGEIITDEDWLDSEFCLTGVFESPGRCDRCNTVIKKNYEVYNPKFGHKIVGSKCIVNLTELDANRVKTIDSVMSSLYSFLSKEWTKGSTKAGKPMLEIVHSHSKLRLYGNGAGFQVAIKVVGRRNWYEWSDPVYNNLDIDTNKKLAFLMLKGLKAELEEDKEIVREIYRNVLADANKNKVIKSTL